MTVTGETSLAERTLGVAEIRRHENFVSVGSNGNSDWDIAVLRLTEHLDLETYIPSCLARTSDRTAFDGDNKYRGDNIVSTRVKTSLMSPKLFARHHKFLTIFRKTGAGLRLGRHTQWRQLLKHGERKTSSDFI